jgi:hypothetical protein
MKATKKNLPLPAPYDKMWHKISKVIDSFHLGNHVNHTCHTKYNPRNIKTAHPDLKVANTVVAEGTFSYIGKFKLAMYKMPKCRQLFFMHRIVTRRNRYLEECHAKNKVPLGNIPRIRREEDVVSPA